MISICVDSLFNGNDYAMSIEKLALNGYKYIEFWKWWDKDINILLKLKEKYNITYTTFCTKFISLVDSNKHIEYYEALKETINIAKILDCKKIITQVGNEILGAERQTMHNNLLIGLEKVKVLLNDNNITLLFEPLNTKIDHENYYLWDVDEAFEIANLINSSSIKILFDVYHQQIMQGDLIRRIEKNINLIGHFHFAGNPGRKEPFFGEINYVNIVKILNELNYKGYFGLEYFNTIPVFEGLKKCYELYNL